MPLGADGGLGRLLRRDRVGFVFQSFNLVPTLNAAENITLPADLGEAALEAVRGGRFDAIVSDYALPGMDGLALVSAVRLENREPIPILMISGHGQEVGDARAGADVFLAKPFSLEQLRSALAKLLGAA